VANFVCVCANCAMLLQDVSPERPSMGVATIGAMSSENRDDKENDDSDMEGWEDDGWGTFDSTSASQDPSHDQSRNVKSSSRQQPLSSGADFFDTFPPSSGGRTENISVAKDPFENMWSPVSDQQSHKSPKAAASAFPPASSMFGSPSESKSSQFEPKAEAEPAASRTGDFGGWDEWSEEDFEEKPKVRECEGK